MKGQGILIPGAARTCGNYLWTSYRSHNALFSTDLSTGFVKYVGRFINESNFYGIHCNMHEYENKLFFIPWNSKNFCVYECKTGEFRSYRLDIEKDFRCILSMDDRNDLYILAEDGDILFQIDMNEERVAGKYFCSGESDEKGNNKEKSSWKLYGAGVIPWKIMIDTHSFSLSRDSIIDDSIVSVCSNKEFKWTLDNHLFLRQYDNKGACIVEFSLTRNKSLNTFDLSDKVKFESHIDRMIYLNDKIYILLEEIKAIISIPILNNLIDINCLLVDKYCYPAGFSASNKEIVYYTGDKLKIINKSGERELILYYDKELREMFSSAGGPVYESLIKINEPVRLIHLLNVL